MEVALRDHRHGYCSGCLAILQVAWLLFRLFGNTLRKLAILQIFGAILQVFWLF